ncbi:testis development-related protein [Mustela erminea]|uniref:testis development-related protein n=1 Tax=Mustela erminea TaxID=36723 RepID=UPI001386E517|nr:testis development-related protein [Mustela erminea]
MDMKGPESGSSGEGRNRADATASVVDPTEVCRWKCLVTLEGAPGEALGDPHGLGKGQWVGALCGGTPREISCWWTSNWWTPTLTFCTRQPSFWALCCTSRAWLWTFRATIRRSWGLSTEVCQAQPPQEVTVPQPCACGGTPRLREVCESPRVTEPAASEACTPSPTPASMSGHEDALGWGQARVWTQPSTSVGRGRSPSAAAAHAPAPRTPRPRTLRPRTPAAAGVRGGEGRAGRSRAPVRPRERRRPGAPAPRDTHDPRPSRTAAAAGGRVLPGVTARRAPPFLLGAEARPAEGSGHAHSACPASGRRRHGDRSGAARAPPPRHRPADLAAPQGRGAAARASARCGPAEQGRGDARTAEPPRSMWKLNRSRVLLDEPPEEEDGLPEGPPRATAAAATAAAAAQVQGASFRGWKEVTSLFSKDDEQHLLERCRSPKSKGTNLRLREELKTEKKSGFWDNLVLKPNVQPKKPDEIEGWEPPALALEEVTADAGDTASGRPPRPGRQEDSRGRRKSSSLASSGNSSRWSLRSAGKLVGIRRQSRGHLTDKWEELE